ncbi:N-formimino-L-glutamate deiminase [compost metagenome]
MQLDRKSELFSGLENPVDLRDGKGDAFAEAVNRIRQSFRMRLFQPRQNNVANIIGVAALIVCRCRVRGEIAGDDAHRP